ncbi:hypothetical protein ABIB40_001120 [Pedobacter sp. UYP30]
MIARQACLDTSGKQPQPLGAAGLSFLIFLSDIFPTSAPKSQSSQLRISTTCPDRSGGSTVNNEKGVGKKGVVILSMSKDNQMILQRFLLLVPEARI